jgi:sigma-B regulation protein RsbU (phosphoserine phosphatase)
MWPKGLIIYPIVSLIYLVGNCMLNATLTSEFVRKTQLESDQTAARQIQQTLIPQTLEEVQGYSLDTYYKPYRDVGGDYFDVIDLPDGRTLFAVADVSGKGMAAALLAANIGPCSRTRPPWARPQVGRYGSTPWCYTPADRFATAVLVLLDRRSGHLTYVNAGHNSPILFYSGSATSLETTGLPLGLFPDSKYESRTAELAPNGTLLIFTDGLVDSISDANPETRLQRAFASDPQRTMADLKSLVDTRLNEDDIIVLIHRTSRV